MPDSSPTRRDLLAAGSAAVLGLAAATDSKAEQTEAASMPEYYELRAYHLRRGPMPTRIDDFLKEALIPAAKRAGCGKVGVFNVTLGIHNPTVYVLICHPTLASFEQLPQKLQQDAEYQKSAAPFLGTPATDPAFVSLDVRLMRAFPHTPKLEAPPKDGKTPRLFELRTYRSHSEAAGVKKIEMFDTAGEIAIFRRVGLTPVFFSQDLTGQGLPSLTYMITYPDLATREKAFGVFRADPEWKKLSTTPGFMDTEIVTAIDNQVLAPTAYSEI